MSVRNLTVARLIEDHIDGRAVEGDAFGDLLDSLGVAPKVESQHVEAIRSGPEAGIRGVQWIAGGPHEPGDSFPAVPGAPERQQPNVRAWRARRPAVSPS